MSQRTRSGFTLTEMLIVIAIILALAALAAAFLPRVDNSQKLTRAVDNLQQWLLTAKMRAKRDGLATGLRFVQVQGDAIGTCSQCQYVQQPQPISGGVMVGPPAPTPPPPSQLPPGYASPYQYPPATGSWYCGGLIASASAAQVTFAAGSVDFSLGNLVAPANQWLVQAGDFLEINGGGVYQIAVVTSPTSLALVSIPPLNYGATLNLTAPTANYRIIRQPRLLIGEEPLPLPNNYAVNFGPIPGSGSALAGTNVPQAASGNWEVVFSSTGAVVGGAAANGLTYISVWDTTMETPDPARVGIIGIQNRSGFIGAYDVSLSGNPFFFVQTARESGL